MDRGLKIILLMGFFFVSCKSGKVADYSERKSPITSQGGQWRSITVVDGTGPVPRHEAAFVGVNGKFYLLGGRGIRPVSIYDTRTGSWTKGSKPPLELHHFQPVVFQQKIYLLGAFTGQWPNETPTTHVYVYDPILDSWSKGDLIPEERRRGGAGAVLYKEKIYLICGIKNGHIGDHKNWLDRYDPRTGEWEQLNDAPRARDHFQAVYANGKIYAAAGRNTGKYPEQPFGATVGAIDVYDIASDQWETLTTPLPTQRAGNAALMFQGHLLVIGGESQQQEKAHAEVEALHLKTHEWRSLPALQEGRHGTGVVLWDNQLFIASGCGNRGGDPELDTMEMYVDKGS